MQQNATESLQRLYRPLASFKGRRRTGREEGRGAGGRGKGEVGTGPPIR